MPAAGDGRRVRLARAARTWREVQRDHEELVPRLLGAGLGVTSCGIGVRGGQFVPRVGVLPGRYADPDVRERVRELCRPHDVVLEPGGPIVPLSLRAPARRPVGARRPSPSRLRPPSD